MKEFMKVLTISKDKVAIIVAYDLKHLLKLFFNDKANKVLCTLLVIADCLDTEQDNSSSICQI